MATAGQRRTMTIPDATRDDVEDGVALDIAARVERINVFDDGNALVKLVDQDGDDLDFKIWSGDVDHSVLTPGKWYVFRTAKGDVYGGEIQIESNYGNASIDPIEDPPTIDQSPSADGSVDESGDAPASPTEDRPAGTVAFDIETVSTVPEDEFDFENSDHLELLSVGVGYAPADGAPAETSVILRSGTTAADERAVVQQFCEYVEDRAPSELRCYEGEDFDVRHLLGRATRLDQGDGLRERVAAVFEATDLRDLEPPGSLEDNAPVEPTYWDVYAHSLDPTTWRESHPNWDDATPVDSPRVANIDVPHFGDRFLELADDVDDPAQGGVEYRALRELIRSYTRADVEPLFDL